MSPERFPSHKLQRQRNLPAAFFCARNRKTGQPVGMSQEDMTTSPFLNELRDRFETEDHSRGMHRTEVRSRSGDSHLGHVFTNDPEIPQRGALLHQQCVPYAKMEAEGHGCLLPLLEEETAFLILPKR